MNSVSALMHFMWSGYVVAAWVMHGLVQAGSSVAVLWDASLKTAVLQGRLLVFEEDEQSLVLLHFTWSGLDVSCCMGNAWVGPSGLFFSRHMGCKLAVRQLCILVHLIAIAVPRPFSSAWSGVLLEPDWNSGCR